MFYLLLESLKIYKLQYLYSILTTIIGTFLIVYFEFDLFIKIMALTLILMPEGIRLTLVQNEGYMKLVHKLPIDDDDLYIHKFVIRSSGTILVVLLLIIINYFFALSQSLFEFINIIVANLFVWITVYEEFHSQNKSLKMNLKKIPILAFSYFIFFGIFKLILQIGLDGNQSGNYILILITQTIIAFNFGKLYNFLRNKFSNRLENINPVSES